ncbi:hypothetical protein M406DRAFT_103520 [Cryphonectria parasitica EP155]|uniref:Uncharacterized protein n=1 Tax=Cryphonectria parasitica (strain ATCC 38755 / EP155) TaxID=660469 RepID=A0A9P4XTV1_CRYP1|nr:uncharacterized protein M406DRAFT_103520 [Cryphonectria parasitica EP155]KAF3760843.1 hypothetical protein M406DRAFT_103520 [Cryphonectria parasitica EP155]
MHLNVTYRPQKRERGTTMIPQRMAWLHGLHNTRQCSTWYRIRVLRPGLSHKSCLRSSNCCRRK